MIEEFVALGFNVCVAQMEENIKVASIQSEYCFLGPQTVKKLLIKGLVSEAAYSCGEQDENNKNDIWGKCS